MSVTPQYTSADYALAANAIRQFTDLPVRAGLVLGSGLGGLADLVENATVVPYESIPGMPRSTVQGHSGRLVIGHLEGVPVVCQQGRAHFYEGYTPQQITFPIRVMKFLGVDTLLLTNAAGGVNPAYRVGDVMIMNDHINLIGMGGNNPLVGANDDALGERFVGMSQVYDRALRNAAAESALAEDLLAHEGVYLCLSGPIFESPAEIRMIRTLGADVVGMSTVHEAVVARHMRMRVFAMSGITNVAIDQIDSDGDTNHEEVLEAGALLVPRMTTILRGVLQSLATSPSGGSAA